MKEDSIYITDEDGKEIEMKIYLTFDANDKKYVVVYEEANEDVLDSFVFDDSNLYAVDDEEELALIEEVISAYEEEN